MFIKCDVIIVDGYIIGKLLINKIKNCVKESFQNGDETKPNEMLASNM